MKNRIKKSLSLLFAVIMLLCAVPIGKNSSVTVKAASTVQNKLDSFISSYPSGGRWIGSFDSGKQCYGFAKLVVYNLFGKNSSGGYRSWSYAGVSTSGMKTLGSITSYSATNVKNLLNGAKCGDVLQFNTTKQHSMIIYSVDSSGVTVYDCNWDNNCGIRKAHVGFGTWSGRNSSKLTLLRSDNYPTDTIVHTVNSSYGKNFTSYPKAKITAGNIYDANHNQISSTAWIGTSDKCTINEVYTDGCCKVSYPLDSGGTKTVYSKISLFNVHTHSYKENYESAHPHKKYMKCSCGDWYYTGATTYLNSCSACNPTKVVFDKDSISLGLSKNKTAQVTATISGNYSHWICEWDGNTIEVDKNQSGNKIVMTISSRTAGTSHLSLKAQDQNYKTIAESAIDVCVNYDYNSTFKFSYSSSDGTGDTLPFTVKYGDTFTVLNNSFKRDGYHFDGWNVKRNSDNTWYVAGVGWCSEESIKNNKYEKKNYTNSQELVFNESWVKGLNSGASYTFYATWIQNNFNMRFDANSGTGYMNKVSTEFDIDYTFPDSSFARKNYVFSGWNVYRVNDGRWATVGYGWLTADELKSKNINKQLFAAEDTYKLDDSWKNGCNDEYIDYIAYATWSPCQHRYSVISTVASTCAKEGYKLFECEICGATKTETISKNPSNHVGGTAVKNVKAATCTAKGYTGDTYCLSCGVITIKGAEIPAKGHGDNNSDGKCDTCGVAFGEPEKPDTPNTPDAPSGNCNHICHKKGIAHFFYLIARLFWKIFNTNKYCSCGTPHY